MSNEGWIKLFRQVQSHPLWTSEKFSPGQAWVDLLLSATHKPRQVIKANTVIELERGQILTSQAELARRWGWHRKTVRRFLSGLERAQMCLILRAIRGDIGHTLLTICNYEVYQSINGDGAHSGTHSGGQSVPIQYPFSAQHYKNVKKGKNEKKKRRGKRKAPRPAPYPILWNKEHEEFHGIDCSLCAERKWDTQHENCGLQALKSSIRKKYADEFSNKWLNAIWESIHDWVATKLEEDENHLEKYKSLGLFVLGWYRREATKERQR